MGRLICFIINDIYLPPLLDATRRQWSAYGEVVTLEPARFGAHSDLEASIKSRARGFEYVAVVRLGDQLSPELLAYIPEFLTAPEVELGVNYVLDHGFNSVPLKWCRRVLVTKTTHFRYDGVQIVPSIGLRDETELEMYYNVGVDLRESRLRGYRLETTLITTQIQLMDEWASVRQYAKAAELGHAILAKSTAPEVRGYVLNQLSVLAMQDQNATAVEDLLLTYPDDISENLLVQADFYWVTGQAQEVVELLADYAEPDEPRGGVPWDRERARAYVYYLLTLAHQTLGHHARSQELATEFYKHSVVLRFQINYVKSVRAYLRTLETRTPPPDTPRTPPDFLLVSQPRTGSTWVQQQLDSHPRLTCYGELLAINKPRFGDVPAPAPLGELVATRETDPVNFVSECMRGESRNGCKILLFQLDQYPGASLWPFLLDNGATRIIYLKRRDVVATYISFLLASNNHYWQTTRGTGRILDTLTVNLRHFRTYLEKMAEWEQTYMSQVHPVALHTVYYEDLVTGGLESVQDFLHVPRADLASQTLIQGRLPLEHLVPNLAEVRRYYAENPLYK